MSHTVRRAVLVAAIGLPCPYCGRAMIEPEHSPSRDHIRSRKRRGTLGDSSNRAIVCWPCNSHKGEWSLERWANRLQRDGDQRADHVAAFLATLASAGRR
ncbi:MAG: hypothetical protein GEV13_28535 [Rhodospirillales bacterium]|nr:hypothetical protein [Rhodospirillales bacterium]